MPRILQSASKKPNVGQRHIGQLIEGEIREIQTTREVVGGKKATLDDLGRGFLLKTNKKWDCRS